MVKFFNQKEEVIQIELTPYGKQKLSNGDFSPFYYAFYDTGILYDGTHGDLTETQNEIVERIKNKTPRLEPITKFTSTNKSVVSVKSLNYRDIGGQQTEYNAVYNRFLGKNNSFSDFFPSWELHVAQPSSVRINDGVEYVSNNTIPVLSASLNIEYDCFQDEDGSTYVLKENDNLTLDIQELNTFFSVNGNVDVEIFKVGPKGELIALGFINEESVSSSGLQEQMTPAVLANTLAGDEQQILETFPVLDDTYVEFYFDILLDQEISGITMPSNSTIYKQNINRNLGNICKVASNFQGTDI
jgi:hypothetical protein